MRRLLALVACALLLPRAGAAQDPTPLDQGVRVGISYNPGVRPKLVVLPGSGLDSVRAILQRDLDYSDRFELLALTGDPAGTAREVNYGLYRALGVNLGVEVVSAGAAVQFRLHDVAAGQVRNETRIVLPPFDSPELRLAVHQAADEIVRWATGTPGYAASALLLLGGDRRLYRVDADGERLTPLSRPGEAVFSPAWAPDGQRIAFTLFEDGQGSITLQRLATGERMTVPGTTAELNYAAAFAPDGRSLAFTRSGESGTDIYSVNLADWCCVRRLTVGRFADNLSPTYAPDGRRLAYVSTRAGPPQIYAMTADGTDQELLAPFDYGVTGSSNGPEWSPDGATLAFHRDIDRQPQIFVMDVASRRVRQLTSAGRNEDPTWAPDGRHLAFVSDRSGRRQLWVIDIETGRVRQIATPGETRLPSWSRRLGAIASVSNP